MLNPLIDRHDDLEQLFELAVARNAVLIVRLRHAIAMLHLHAPDHPRRINWTKCTHEDCRKAAELLSERGSA